MAQNNRTTPAGESGQPPRDAARGDTRDTARTEARGSAQPETETTDNRAGTDTSGGTGQTVTDDQRAEAWGVPVKSKGGARRIPVRVVDQDVADTNTYVSAIPVRLGLFPSSMADPKTFAGMVGVAPAVDPGKADLVFFIAEKYRGAIRKEHDIATLQADYATHGTTGMLVASLQRAHDDTAATETYQAACLGPAFDEILAEIKEDAAAGNPEARAAVGAIEDYEQTEAAKKHKTTLKVSKAKAAGEQGSHDLQTQLSQALSTVEQLQLTVNELKQQNAQLRASGGAPPPAVPAQAPKHPPRATPR